MSGCGWDPSFFRKSPLFWAVAPAATALERFTDWPTPDDLRQLFDREAPVRFVLAAPKPRRGRAPADARYDARIALERVVATRARSWHDLLNALVWASFPRAKLALHERQHRMIAARLGEDLRLPGARTKEQDAVAMLDEGGVAVLCVRGARRARGDRDLAELIEQRSACAIVFGHAIYESLACGGPASVRAAARVIDVDAIDGDARARVRAADAALAELLSRERPIVRGDFEPLVVGERLERASAAGSG